VFEYNNYFFPNTVFVSFVSNIYEQPWYNILLIFIFVGNHEHIINDCSFLWVSLYICCERMGFFLLYSLIVYIKLSLSSIILLCLFWNLVVHKYSSFMSVSFSLLMFLSLVASFFLIQIRYAFIHYCFLHFLIPLVMVVPLWIKWE